MRYITYAISAIVLLFILVSWHVFQWRNPTCNESAFVRNFYEVVTFQILDEYQTEEK